MASRKTIGVAILVGLSAGVLSAKTCTWTTGGGTWSDAGNWANGDVPAAGDDVVFSDAAKKGGVISLEESTLPAFASLTFSDTNSGGWNLTNGTLTVHQDGTVVSNSKAATTKICATIAGAGDLVKKGDGTLSLSGDNAFTGRFVVEDGRLQPETPVALGPDPAVYTADAIVLKGGMLGTADAMNFELVIGPTRGITIDGAGELCPRSDGVLRIQSPIVGTGDLRFARQAGTVQIEAPCTYSGRTLFANAGLYYTGEACIVKLVGDGRLPEGTTLIAQADANKTISTYLHVNGTVQRVKALETAPLARLMIYGSGASGLVRFGTVEDNAVAVSNVYVSAGATLAYAGAGTVTAQLTTAAGTTFALESGTLAVTPETALGPCAVSLGAGTTVALTEGVSSFANDFVLNGNAALTATESVVTLTGNLTRTADGAVLTVADGTSVTFGAKDAVTRRLAAPIVVGEGQTVTLDGWVESTLDPAGYAKTQDCVVFGPYAGVSAGNLALDGQVRGIQAVSELGSGTETISLVNGSRLVIAADADFTAAYSVTVDATSTLELGGTGLIDLAGATFSGAGTVKVAGATVRLAGTTDGLSFSGPGTIDVPEGQTVTLAWTEGQLEKTGAGTLVLTGTQVAEVQQLTVSAGTVRLAFTDGAKLSGNITVAEGATLALDGDEQINNAYSVVLNGTFDLNGHTESIKNYNNKPPKNALRETTSAAIVNRSTEPATLTSNEESAFFGRITEEPGKIEIVQTSGMMDPVGTVGSVTPSSIRVPTGTTGILFPYSRWGSYRFVFYTTRENKERIQLSQIQLTSQGVPIPVEAISSYSSTSVDGTHTVNYLFDNRADTYWQSLTTNVSVEVATKGDYYPVDGYRLGANTVGNAPMDWDVYVFRADPTGWFLVDRRRGERIVRADSSWSTFDRTMSSNYLFSAESRPRAPLAATTAVNLENKASTALRISSVDPFTIGALSGPGGIRFEDGSTFAPGNLTDWTGTFSFQNCADLLHQARLQLSSERGPAAQPVRMTSADANVSIENGGTQPVSVLVNDDVPQPLRGRLADGNGPLGLVKRGAGDFVLGTANCANTGVTSIEEGCLKVCGTFGANRAVTARYLRIWPTKNNAGNDSNGFNWGMNDFQILDADDTRIAFPAGTTVTGENGFHSTQTGARLIDGDIATRTLVWNTDAEKTAKKGYCSWVVIDMKEPVTFNGYRWYTAHGNAVDQNRVPVAWTLEVSDDGEDWSIVDVGAEKYDLAYGTGNDGYLRGPYGLRGEADGVQTLATIPSDFFAETTARSTRAPALKSRYFKFQPHETYSPTANSVAYGWMISEFSLFRNGERVDWPKGASPALVGGGLNQANGSALAKFCDNVTTGLTDTANLHRVYVTQLPTFITVDAGEEMTFDAYGFFSAAGGGRDERLPTTWTLSVSTNGKDWVVIDEQENRRNIVKADYRFQGAYSVADRYPLLGATSATDALGDASPVAIAAGASLAIDSAYEKFGTLSGSGTLVVNVGSVAEVNACTEGTFSGTISGMGTFAVSGVATQTFASATLKVSQLELNGGTVAGTATRTGNLEVAFNGGAWAGTLNVDGALKVTGTPAFAVPTVTGSTVRQTLFTFKALDDVSRDALKGAEVDGRLPPGLKAKVVVGETACILTASADGTVLLFR